MRTSWTATEIAILERVYPVGGRVYAFQCLQAAGFNRTRRAIKAKAQQLKIRSANNGRFQKGHLPKNKGKKRTSAQRERSSSTWFQNGSLPHNTLYDGAVTTRKFKDRKYYWIRLSLNNWKPLHRYLWEKAYGKIPKGHVVRFKDGDPMNCTLDNLELMNRRKNMQRTKMQYGGGAPERLTDGYVRWILKQYHELEEENISPEMIELKRAQLLLNREIKSKENE